jgi:hypothetical protein
MITIIDDEDKVEISISETELIKSIAKLEDVKEFCKKKSKGTEGEGELLKAFDVAIEVMKAFWCEHFDDEDEEEE